MEGKDMKNKYVLLGIVIMFGLTGGKASDAAHPADPIVTEVAEPTEDIESEIVMATEEKAEVEQKEETPAFTVSAASGTKYATQSVNVRKGPSTDYDKAGSLSLNEEIQITGQADTGWYEFERNGEKLYVSNKYVSDTKTEVKQQAKPETPDNKTNVADAAEPVAEQPESEQFVESDFMNDAGEIEYDEMPGLIFEDDKEPEPEYIEKSEEEREADRREFRRRHIARNGWEPGETCVEYEWVPLGDQGSCDKITYYIISDCEYEIISREVITGEEYEKVMEMYNASIEN